MALSLKSKQLLQRLADGQFHSGAAIAVDLNLSRSAIWKHIQGLVALGIEVDAVSGKGYRLETPLHLLDTAVIKDNLIPTIPAFVLEIVEQCESTNNTLMAEVRQGLVAHKVCLAEYQTAGRGRRGRQWVAPFGQNIILSVLWRFESGTSAIAGLSLVIGVAVVRALSNRGITDIGLKWPNDLYWQDRKLGGILIEVIGETNGPCSVIVGLGLNGYLPPKVATDINQVWVDLKQIMGSSPDRNVLTAALLNHIMPVLAEFEHTDLSSYLQEWRQYDCMLGKNVTVLLHNQLIHGIVKGINDEGLLLLQNAEGEVQAFASGEISFNTQS